jgi:hypothetical protein
VKSSGQTNRGYDLHNTPGMVTYAEAQMSN